MRDQTRPREKKVRYEFPREGVGNLVGRRQSLFLDTNAWIDLAESKRSCFTSLKEVLSNAVRAGQVFCPLSAPVIWELLMQNEGRRVRVARLMDKLSLNVSMAIIHEVFREELWNLVCRILGLQCLAPLPGSIWVPLLAYLSSSYEIVYADSWSDEAIAKFGALASTAMASLSLTELLQMREDSGHGRLTRKPRPGYSDSTRRRWLFSRGDRRRMRRVEEEAVSGEFVIPFLSALPLDVRQAFFQKLRALPKDEYGGYIGFILQEAPALRNYVELLTVSGLDPNRKDRPSDFFDLDMIPVPIAYAGAFFTQDKWMLDLLRRRGTFLERTECRLFGEAEDVEAFVKSLG